MNNQDNKPAQASTHSSSLALKEILSFNWERIVEASQNDKYHAERVFQEFIQMVESNHRTQRSPKFYADKLNMTISNLGKICQKVIGYPPSHCIQIRLMLEACAMLKDSKPIKEIAFELGFEAPKHFSKFFKKQSGQYPDSFRKITIETH